MFEENETATTLSPRICFHSAVVWTEIFVQPAGWLIWLTLGLDRRSLCCAGWSAHLRSQWKHGYCISHAGRDTLTCSLHNNAAIEVYIRDGLGVHMHPKSWFWVHMDPHPIPKSQNIPPTFHTPFWVDQLKLNISHSPKKILDRWWWWWWWWYACLVRKGFYGHVSLKSKKQRGYTTLYPQEGLFWMDGGYELMVGVD